MDHDPNMMLKVVSMNVRGMRNQKKRKSLFYQFKRGKYDIICVQDTHLTYNDKDTITKEWGNNFHIVEGTNKSKGLLTLYSKTIDSEKVSVLFENERCLISKLLTEDSAIAIVNIYSPCSNAEKITFLNSLNINIYNICNKHSIENVILLGDFNLVKDNDLDIVSGLPHLVKTVQIFNNVIKNLDLIDIWRKTHGRKKDFSWSCNTPFTARRLDYIFTSLNLLPFCINCELINIGFSDHKAVLVSMDFSKFKRGPGTYKFNTKLLHNNQFVSEVKQEILKINQMNLTPHEKWEYVKIQIKELGKIYGKSIAAENHRKKKETLINLKNAENQLAKNPHCKDVLFQWNKLKHELELILMNETEGAIIRSRQKWAEEGEKCSKYFLNLEKQRSNMNTIFRLKSEKSSSIISDCEGITAEIKNHFQSLYKYQPVNENSLFFSPSKEQHLNEEDIAYLDSPITEADVLLALKKSRKGSAPGLDGLPSEIYSFFWNDIKEILIDCINFSYIKGELCYTQKQGVISLIYKGKGLDRDIVSNWRPISLTNLDYKLIAKVLAMR